MGVHEEMIASIDLEISKLLVTRAYHEAKISQAESLVQFSAQDKHHITIEKILTVRGHTMRASELVSAAEEYGTIPEDMRRSYCSAFQAALRRHPEMFTQVVPFKWGLVAWTTAAQAAESR